MNIGSVFLGITAVAMVTVTGCAETDAANDLAGSPDPASPREPYRYRLPDGRIAVGTGVRVGEMLLIGGDVLIPAHQDQDNGKVSNAAVSGDTWPHKTIVYTFSSGVSAATRAAVLNAAAPWTAAGFSFRERTTEAVYLDIQPSSFTWACSATVGYHGPLNNFYWAAPNCRVRDFVHEWGHVLGLFHEHERTDRDQFVWVDPRIGATIAGRGGINWGPYDFGSIMHYDAYDRDPITGAIDFNEDHALIRPLDGRPLDSFGWNDAPDASDLATVRSLYWSEYPCGPSVGTICP